MTEVDVVGMASAMVIALSGGMVVLWRNNQASLKDRIDHTAQQRVKFRWLEDEEDGLTCYFEIRIQVDEITKDVSLMVTDFADEDEVEESKMLWENMIGSLKQVLGSV